MDNVRSIQIWPQSLDIIFITSRAWNSHIRGYLTSIEFDQTLWLNGHSLREPGFVTAGESASDLVFLLVTVQQDSSDSRTLVRILLSPLTLRIGTSNSFESLFTHLDFVPFSPLIDASNTFMAVRQSFDLSRLHSLMIFFISHTTAFTITLYSNSSWFETIFISLKELTVGESDWLRYDFSIATRLTCVLGRHAFNFLIDLSFVDLCFNALVSFSWSGGVQFFLHLFCFVGTWIV